MRKSSDLRDLEFDGDRGSLVRVLCSLDLKNQVLVREPERGKREYAPPRTLGSPKCARIIKSFPPGSCLIRQTKADFSGT